MNAHLSLGAFGEQLLSEPKAVNFFPFPARDGLSYPRLSLSRRSDLSSQLQRVRYHLCVRHGRHYRLNILRDYQPRGENYILRHCCCRSGVAYSLPCNCSRINCKMETTPVSREGEVKIPQVFHGLLPILRLVMGCIISATPAPPPVQLVVPP